MTEMLRHAGFAERSGALGGKRTEDHMAPFLREAVAAQMSRRGSIGIAKMIAARLEEGAQSPSADPAVGSEQSAVGAMAARRDP
ncbi:MAG: rod-binding protein [Pseudomonadota bacterium]